MNTTKRITLAVAIFGTIGTVLAAIEGSLPPAWAALVAALGSGVYAIARTLQKRSEISEWKTLLRTTETWGSLLAIVAPIVLAVAGLMSGERAAQAALVAAAMLKIARALQENLPGGPKCKSGITGMSRGQHDKGAVSVPILFFLVVLVALVSIFGTRDTQAEQFGGCFAGGQLCAGPAVTVTVGELNLSTQKFGGGVSPGVGYGLTYAPDRWYSTGMAGYLAFTVGGAQPNSARPALMLSFANYLRLGVGMAITEQDVGTLKQWSLLFGVGSDFGGSPSYVRAARAQ